MGREGEVIYRSHIDLLKPLCTAETKGEVDNVYYWEGENLRGGRVFMSHRGGDIEVVILIYSFHILKCFILQVYSGLNNGHSGDRPLVHCREVFPFADVMPCMLQSAGGKQFVFSTDVVCFSECPLSEVTLYSFHITIRMCRK